MMLWIYGAEVADLWLFYQYKYGGSFNNQMQVITCIYLHLFLQKLKERVKSNVLIVG